MNYCCSWAPIEIFTRQQTQLIFKFCVAGTNEQCENHFVSNTSLAAPGALAHRLQRPPPATPYRLQHLTARLIQNGRRGLERG